MDEDPKAVLAETTLDYVKRIASMDPADDKFATAIKNVSDFSKIQITAPEPPPEPTPPPVPQTPLEKAKCVAVSIWESETFRVLLKAGGAFGGVWFVTRATIKQDHVLERQALAQANQRST